MKLRIGSREYTIVGFDKNKGEVLVTYAKDGQVRYRTKAKIKTELRHRSHDGPKERLKYFQLGGERFYLTEFIRA